MSNSTLFPYTTLFRSKRKHEKFQSRGRRWKYDLRGPCYRVGYPRTDPGSNALRSEEHTSELQSPCNLVCCLLLEKKKILSLLSCLSIAGLILIIHSIV